MQHLREIAQLFSATTKMLFRANGEKETFKIAAKKKITGKRKKKIALVFGCIAKKHPE